MRVLLAPDCFGGTLSAREAADAMVAGWRQARPGDELIVLPLSDGGPGFLDVVPGELQVRTVQDPLGRPVHAAFRLAADTAWVETAQACGLHLLDPGERDPTVTTTYGVGQLVQAAVEAGARTVVLGLGGSATNDGGVGLLAALGLIGCDGKGTQLPPGGLALAGLASLRGTLPAALRRQPANPSSTVSEAASRWPAATAAGEQPAGPPGPPGPPGHQPGPPGHQPGPAAPDAAPAAAVQLIAATDVDAPLLGPTGASAVFGPQKGADPAQVRALDAALARWADVVEAHLGVRARDLPGAGAAGGMGFALLALGGSRAAGIELVADAVGLTAAVAGVDLVVTGEGSFDATSLRGKVVSGVAARAQEGAVPCVVVAGQVSVGRREAAAAGVDASYALVEVVGVERAMSQAAESVALVTGQVAVEWSR